MTGRWLCPQCGGISPVETNVCPHCTRTGAMLRLSSDEMTLGRDAVSEQADAPETFGRYRDLQWIGSGGMGKVYRAFDPTLNRTVALKFIHGNDPELEQRLLTEARAQARIEHPFVCRVHEVGDIDGKPYISMQYIHGKTLREMISVMSLPQKVRLMMQVTEALHAAHRAGLIHRDIKPSNIMVEETGTGDWVPCIMDFGLARVLDTSGMTQSGMVMGSPHYMSPEQARGEVRNLDRRSDVYSIGATTYEVLCGKRPFEDDSSVQVLVQVIYNDPIPLRKRDASIPYDLETIVMKCLEKDPDRRYDSARALAEDLSRYLNGDPISARPASFPYRLRKRAAKNRKAAAIVIVAAAIATIAAGWAVWTQWNARKQAALAQKFSLDVKDMEDILRSAHTLPIHDIRRERLMVRQRMHDIELQMANVGAAGFGPCQYAIGRGYLALGEYEQARDHLQQAWQSGYTEPAVAYSLGKTLGILYDKEMEQTKNLDPSQRDRRVQELQKTLRDPALTFLNDARTLRVDSPAYVEGLIAFYDGRFDEAIAKSNQAFQDVPWLYEARKLEGDIRLVVAESKHNSGEYEEAARQLDAAGKAYAEAGNIARSDPTIYANDCMRWILTMELRQAMGSDSSQPFHSAVAACGLALKVFPESSDAFDRLAWANWRWGEALDARGEDPREVLRAGISFARKSLQYDPRSLQAWTRIGAAYNTIGEYELEHGLDPTQSLQSAIASAERMRQIDRGYPYAYNVLGYGALTLAEYQMQVGSDPRKSLQQAIQAFETTVKFDKLFAKGHNNLGYTYLTKGIYETSRGIDARVSFDRAVATFQQAIDVNRKYAGAYSNQAMTYVRKAEYEFQYGLDPTVSLGKALQAAQQSFKMNPESSFSANVQGLAWLTGAEYEASRRQPYPPSLESAIQWFETALKLKPDSENACRNLVRAYLFAAAQDERASQNPAEAASKARTQLAVLRRINPQSAMLQEAELLLVEARYASGRHSNPAGLLERAKQLLDRHEIAEDPESTRLRAELFYQMARNSEPGRVAYEENIRSGFQALSQLLEINPRNADAMARRSLLLRLQDPARNRAEADELLARALQINLNLKYLYAR